MAAVSRDNKAVHAADGTMQRLQGGRRPAAPRSGGSGWKVPDGWTLHGGCGHSILAGAPPRR